MRVVCSLSRILGLALSLSAMLSSGSLVAQVQAPGRSVSERFQVPPGFVIEQVAGPPLVRYPLFACFDDRGRLYVAEGTGTNLPGPELLPKKLGKITLLEDTDGDGKFDKNSTFADQLVFPQGVLWHDGIVYTASHPSLWRMQDTNGDDRADRVEPLVDGFRFTGNGCDLHGPFLGPDGRLYWTDGRHGYKINTREGTCLEGFAARIFRCKTDGTDIERVCGGGFDNPVEIVFTPGGELIGTMDQGPGDCLLHYVEGGVYPMEHPCVSEFPLTGPLLPAVKQYTAALPVALCGIERYRSAAFGDEFRDTLLTAQFNVHRIEQHRLVRDGSTFRSVEKDFITSTDYDTHFTDVLEDADGSVLIVDMGAWFNYGCPTSKIARPEVLGAIYRVRRVGAMHVDDPWGRTLQLERRTPEELVSMLDEARPKVRDRAISQLASHGSESVPALANILSTPRSVESRRNAVWTLGRIGPPTGLPLIRKVFADPDPTVRRAAVQIAGLWRDMEATSRLAELAAHDEPPVRLAAAESLGRLGNESAVAAVFDSLRQGAIDRFLEHALTYALIRSPARSAIAAGLHDSHPRVRQAALIALDQSLEGRLTREEIVPLLDTDDPELQTAVLQVMSKHPDWARETTALLREWLDAAQPTPQQESSLSGLLLAFGAEPDVQPLITERLTKGSTAIRTLLLRVVGRSRLEPLPAPWLEALRQALSSEQPVLQREALTAVKSRALTQFDNQLVELASNSKLPSDLRVAAWDGLSARQPPVSDVVFALLVGQIEMPTDPLASVMASRALGSSTLTKPQLARTAELIASGGPLLVPLLAPAFSKGNDAGAGNLLAAALMKSPGASALATEDLDKLLARYPIEVQAAVQPLRKRLAARQSEQEAYLAKLTLSLLQTPGNAERGREVYFSKKAACYGCHRAAGKGGAVGPDLSQVGRFRTTRDLLESVVYPSSSIVPQFRSYAVITKDGRATTGMIVRENSDAVFLRTSQLAEIRIAHDDVEEMNPSNQSLMPDGLEKTMSAQELADLLEFLFHQK